MLAWLERRNPRWNALWVFLGFLLAACLGVADYRSGPDLSFLLFYLFPAFLGSWFGGRRAGILISLFSSVAWLLDDVMAKSPHSHPAIPYWNVGVKLLIFFAFVHLTVSVRELLNREKQLARTDDLTGIENRRSFAEASETELRRLRRYRHPFTIAYMDIDNFKTVNDLFGHSTGDSVLRSVAISILRSIRETDHAARLGGDEFAVILAETDQAGARVVMERLLKNWDDVIQKKQWPISLSIGVVSCYEPPDSVDTLIRAADDLMCVVKNSGKNNVKYGTWNGDGKKA